MVIKIYDNHIENCKIGVSAPKDANVEIGINKFVNCGKAIELRDTPGLLEILGLRPNVPVDKLVHVLREVSGGTNKETEIRQAVEKGNLHLWLSAGANVTTLVGALHQLASSSLMKNAIAILLK